MPVTSEQIKQLQEKFANLSADKTLADQATSASNTAHADLQAIMADVAEKDAAEATADGQVTADLAELRAIIDALSP